MFWQEFVTIVIFLLKKHVSVLAVFNTYYCRFQNPTTFSKNLNALIHTVSISLT